MPLPCWSSLPPFTLLQVLLSPSSVPRGEGTKPGSGVPTSPPAPAGACPEPTGPPRYTRTHTHTQGQPSQRWPAVLVNWVEPGHSTTRENRQRRDWALCTGQARREGRPLLTTRRKIRALPWSSGSAPLHPLRPFQRPDLIQSRPTRASCVSGVVLRDPPLPMRKHSSERCSDFLGGHTASSAQNLEQKGEVGDQEGTQG